VFYENTLKALRWPAESLALAGAAGAGSTARK
jgi:hypothetical protein